ncbi:MAG: hypothetical protein JXR91_04520 [Deltaproteobacteria bacterium]|nr:hypothetical protein [Deltaproteobacteria bacterium]
MFILTAAGAVYGSVDGTKALNSGGKVLFNASRLSHLLALIFFITLFFYFIWRGKKGKELYIRPIDAIYELDNAVGRACETGKPVLYAPGLGSLTDPVTVASLNILSKVAQKGAGLYTRTLVPNYGPLTWPVAQEVVRQAYIRAGKEKSYNSDDVPYFTSRSFTYAAATAGLMSKEKPATNFLIGHFYSESLILAETGAALGAYQIGGTDSVEQLPFFITTCDKTLIGEEIFAASALVSKNPVERAVIKASDVFKIVILIFFLGGFLATLMLDTFLQNYISGDILEFLNEFRTGEWL